MKLFPRHEHAVQRAIVQQQYEITRAAVVTAENRLLEEILDRELANWRKQPWLRDTVNLKQYPTQHLETGSARRVCVYIKDRWVGGYDLRISAYQDEIMIEGVQLNGNPDSPDAASGSACPFANS